MTSQLQNSSIVRTHRASLARQVTNSESWTNSLPVPVQIAAQICSVQHAGFLSGEASLRNSRFQFSHPGAHVCAARSPHLSSAEQHGKSEGDASGDANQHHEHHHEAAGEEEHAEHQKEACKVNSGALDRNIPWR